MQVTRIGLLRIEFPFKTMMAAGAYVDKYGATNEYDWLGFIDRVDVPTLLLFGEIELNENPAFEGLEVKFDQLSRDNASLTIDVIPGADHFYSARYREACEQIRQWLMSYSA